MGQMLIRDLDDQILKRLKQRAKRNGRSLQSEAKMILEQAVAFDPESGRALVARIRKRLAGRVFDDSTLLIREDRDA